MVCKVSALRTRQPCCHGDDCDGDDDGGDDDDDREVGDDDVMARKALLFEL